MPTPTKNTAPDFTSKGVCDILRACRNLNVKKISFGGCDIEFHSEHPVVELPEFPKAHLGGLQKQNEDMDVLLRQQIRAQEELSAARHQYEDKRVTPADDKEVKDLLLEQDLMANYPSAWEEMQIDSALRNVQDEQNREMPQTDSSAYKTFAANRQLEGAQ